jgi:hypothetical protein
MPARRFPSSRSRCALRKPTRWATVRVVGRSGSALWDEAVARYRLHAAHCAELAEQIPDAEGRLTFLAMAQSWLSLAEQAVKNSETALAYETPMPKQVP